ncbi:ECF transporter S component [Staphylococcus sp. NRL 16/872]|uniref:ECF transporter S component n=1 Tax=Staphylococcus sp. NRL 16/872 TaxID=2930131 RepID=UPI001FB378DE|nr:MULTISPECIES: ECF transporter S component [unclassified Staphylococcus]MCJ1655306.1 ECF transporter S component [Staphylococcus sp. NRL 21/187]MCJ1661142.1 ECF transporter S component [Staphylococcus sp. NRL 18/288]MCJ1667035.1 ECF transporter S component [Staphylococcus sp. NRL 19/737]WEN69511.1 ECF transporter S component [Staphylococcus sp. NRL 16/872]
MKKLNLSDILVTVLISFIFGLVYKGVGLTVAALKPLGLHLDQIAYGLWFIAAIVAFLIIRKPGVALLAELAAGSGETILSGDINMSILLHSLAQGLACEIIFLIFKYKSTKLAVTMLAGATAGIFTIPIDWIFNYLGNMAMWNIILLYSIRIVSGTLLSGALGYYIVKALEKTGVTKLYHSASKEDFDEL